MIVDAVVLAGGSGTRMGLPHNKVYLPVCGQPLIRWPLGVLDQANEIRNIVLVIRAEDRATVEDMLVRWPVDKLSTVVEGGPTRQLSEVRGLAVLSKSPGSAADLVLIHDGARPVLSENLLHRLLRRAYTTGGAIPGLPFDMPVFCSQDDRLAAPADRDALRRVQTPQVFAHQPLMEAYGAAEEADFEGLDTAEVIQRFTDLPIDVVDGDPDNIKVTFTEDLTTVATALGT